MKGRQGRWRRGHGARTSLTEAGRPGAWHRGLAGRAAGQPREIPPGTPKPTKCPRRWGDAGWLRGQTTRRRIHRRSDGGPERRHRCPGGGPEHRPTCYTEPPPCASRPHYKRISPWTRPDRLRSAVFRRPFVSSSAAALRRAVCARNVGLAGPRGVRICNPIRALATRRRLESLRQVRLVRPEPAAAGRLAAAIGEDDREVRDRDRADRGDGGQPPEAVDEQHDRDHEADEPDAHHDQVPALTVAD